MEDDEIFSHETPEPGFLGGLIILFMVLISELFFMNNKKK